MLRTCHAAASCRLRAMTDAHDRFVKDNIMKIINRLPIWVGYVTDQYIFNIYSDMILRDFV